jgi:hypothetical protein
VSQFEALFGTGRMRDSYFKRKDEPNEFENDPDSASFYLDEQGNKLNGDLLTKKIVAYMAEQYPGKYAGLGGYENNWAQARSIIYKGERIRVFPVEFSVLTHENMALYLGLTGDEQSHELVPDTVAEQRVTDEILTGSLKEIYDAGLVDGCTPGQATALALGVEIAEPVHGKLADFPPVGWYRCKPEYARAYCSKYEMEETPVKTESPKPRQIKKQRHKAQSYL